MKDVRCPYCGTEQDINHNDGYGYDEYILHHQECVGCGKSFVYTTYVLYSYETSRADCLNDGKHIFKASDTYPKLCTEMYCIHCGKVRPPTAEEWKEIYKEKE